MPALRKLDDIALMLEATDRYRVLRRVPEIDITKMSPARDGSLIGVALDCEATSTDPASAHVIEVAAVKFAYRPDNSFDHYIEMFEGLQEPPSPLDPDVSRLTGLTDSDLVGRRIDKTALTRFLADGTNLLIAHASRYDRALLERWLEGLPLRPWGCSLEDVDWRREGLNGRRLGDILLAHGLYNDGHRAKRDVDSLMQILLRPLPISGRTGLDALLRRARRCTAVIFAEASPMSARAVLRSRAYRWSGDEAGVRAWWVEVDADLVADEVEFLSSEVYGGRRFGATMTLISALHRGRPLAVIAKARVPLTARQSTAR